MLKVKSMPGVLTVDCDQCMYGFCDRLSNLPHKKPTKIMTSSREIGSRLSRTCDRSHSHQPLLGKVKHDGTWHARSRLAQEYPDEFCGAICRGLQAEKESRLQARAVYCVLAIEDMGLSGSATCRC